MANKIVEAFHKDNNLPLDVKTPLEPFVKWCKKNDIVLLKTQSQKQDFLDKNPDSVVLTLIEFFKYISTTKKDKL